METFSIKEALVWGWERFKERPWFFIGTLLIIFGISAVLGAVMSEDVVGTGLAGIGQLVATVLQWWLYIGFVGILLAVYSNQPVTMSDLFAQKGRTLWHYALATILYFLIVLGGLILLIVPGIIWGIKFHYYIYLIVERGLDPIAALKESAHITDGRKWTLFGFFIVVGLLNLAGALVIGVGLLVSIPVTVLASVWVYKWLSENRTKVVKKVDAPVSPKIENS